MSLLDDLKAANSSVVAALAFEHPQYIDGSLYVTREQYMQILDWGSELPLDPTNTRPAPALEIPVVVVADIEAIQ